MFWPFVPPILLALLALGLWVWQNSGSAGVQGQRQLEAGHYAQAVSSFTTALTNDPSNAALYGDRGLAYAGMKEYDKAIDDYTKALELGAAATIQPTLYNNRGLARFNANQTDLALDDYTKAIELKADYAIAYLNRAQVHQRFERNEQALADYSKAIELDPQFAQAYIGRGQVNAALGNSDQAFADYNTALEKNPKLAVAYLERANIYLARGEAENSIKDLRAAIANARPEEDYLKFRAEVQLQTLEGK